MIKIRSFLFLATLLGSCLHPAQAQAQYVRTCVSAKGNDANTCHCTQPCRSFQRAHDQTLADGEITVLDPAGYGPVTITKSISIVNDGGGEASIQVSGGGIGILVRAPAAAYVNLRGITIQGVGFGESNGLILNTGFALTVENCVMRNLTGDGIGFFPTNSSHLAVSHTLVADNGGDGIAVIAGSGAPGITVKAEFNRVEAYNNSGSGFLVSGALTTGKVNAVATDSIAANNGTFGFRVSSLTGSAPTSFIVDRSVAANNGTGLRSDFAATATLRVGQSTITGNTTAWSAQSGAILRSYGDNSIGLNDNGDPAPPTTALK